MPRPTEIVAAKRYCADGTPLDLFIWPMSRNGCNSVSAIWVDRLQKGLYSRIELRMANGQTVVVKRKAAKVLEFRAPPGVVLLSGAIEADGLMSLRWRERGALERHYHIELDTMEPRPEAGDAV